MSVGEELHREWRPMGEPRWIDLTLDQRTFWDDVAKAADRFLSAPEDFYCEDCADYRYKVDDLEDEVYELTEELKKLKKAQEA